MSVLVRDDLLSNQPKLSGLTAFDSYNLRQQDLAVVDIGIQRAVAVIAGILWAAFVSRFWWPSEARRELSESLSE